MEFRLEVVKLAKMFLQRGGRATLKKIHDDIILLAAEDFETRLRGLTYVRPDRKNKRFPKTDHERRPKSKRVDPIPGTLRPPVILEAEVIESDNGGK